MFQNWQLLLVELGALLLIAVALGLLIGWIIWGRRAR